MSIEQRIIDSEKNDLVPPKFIPPGAVDILSLTLSDNSAVQIITMCDGESIGKVILRHPKKTEKELQVAERNSVMLGINFEGITARIVWKQVDSEYEFYTSL